MSKFRKPEVAAAAAAVFPEVQITKVGVIAKTKEMLTGVMYGVYIISVWGQTCGQQNMEEYMTDKISV